MNLHGIVFLLYVIMFSSRLFVFSFIFSFLFLFMKRRKKIIIVTFHSSTLKQRVYVHLYSRVLYRRNFGEISWNRSSTTIITLPSTMLATSISYLPLPFRKPKCISLFIGTKHGTVAEFSSHTNAPVAKGAELLIAEFPFALKNCSL